MIFFRDSLYIQKDKNKIISFNSNNSLFITINKERCLLNITPSRPSRNIKIYNRFWKLYTVISKIIHI
jgi:hypothetical protein